MDEVANRVLEESRKFRARLPELMKTYEDRWVVFRDDAVTAAFDDEEEAYIAGIEKYGVRGGFVIARVAADTCEPIPVSAGLFFATMPE